MAKKLNALTKEYNELASQLGIPTVKSNLRKNRDGDPAVRVGFLRDQVAAMEAEARAKVEARIAKQAANVPAAPQPAPAPTAPAVNTNTKTTRKKHKLSVANDAGFLPCKEGSSIHILIEAVLDKPGSTVYQLQTAMMSKGVDWKCDSIAASLSWDARAKGYICVKEGRGKAATYTINNATSVYTV